MAVGPIICLQPAPLLSEDDCGQVVLPVAWGGVLPPSRWIPDTNEWARVNLSSLFHGETVGR